MSGVRHPFAASCGKSGMKLTHPFTVAVLDHDADLAATVARLLVRRGFEARAFVDPQTLLGTLSSYTFGCVISDIGVGDMDGFAFAEALRVLAPHVALVFMTAWPTTTHAVDAVRRYGGLD